jgi:hypothetical protein
MCGLAKDAWERHLRVTDLENAGQAITFSEELEAIGMELKFDAAPDPDGFLLPFFKKVWASVKYGVLHIPR